MVAVLAGSRHYQHICVFESGTADGTLILCRNSSNFNLLRLLAKDLQLFCVEAPILSFLSGLTPFIVLFHLVTSQWPFVAAQEAEKGDNNHDPAHWKDDASDPETPFLS